MALKNISEPPDGTMIVLTEWDGDRKVIWRSDEDLDPEAVPGEYWFDDVQSDGMSWEAITKYADQAFLVSAEPLREHNG